MYLRLCDLRIVCSTSTYIDKLPAPENMCTRFNIVFLFVLYLLECLKSLNCCPGPTPHIHIHERVCVCVVLVSNGDGNRDVRKHHDCLSMRATSVCSQCDVCTHCFVVLVYVMSNVLCKICRNGIILEFILFIKYSLWQARRHNVCSSTVPPVNWYAARECVMVSLNYRNFMNARPSKWTHTPFISFRIFHSVTLWFYKSSSECDMRRIKLIMEKSVRVWIGIHSTVFI